VETQNLKNWLNTEEGKNSILQFFDDLNKKNEITISQLERLYKTGNFVEFTEKVILKYNDSKYRYRWLKRGIDPPEDLMWFLSVYAEKYGRECNESEWKEYGNEFTTSLFFCDGFYFNQMDGQGSIIKIIKK